MLLRQLRWAILWAIFILVVCLMPGSSVPKYDLFSRLHADKLVHVFIFGVLLVLLMKGLLRQDNSNFLRQRALFTAFAVAVIYGAITELLQEFIASGREGDLGDLAANTIGAILGAVWMHWGEARKTHFGERQERYF